MKIQLFFTFFFISIHIHASERRDVHDLFYAADEQSVTNVLKTIRDITETQAEARARMLARERRDLGICIECNNLLGLTDDVTKVLIELGEAGDEVGELVFVQAFLRHVDEEGQEKCLVFHENGMSREFSDPDVEDAIVLFHGEFDLDRLQTWRISGGNLPGPGRPGDTIFMRGRGPDNDIFVRVDLALDPGAPPRVTVYKLQNVPSNLMELERDVFFRDLNLPELGGGDTPSWQPGWKENGTYDGSLHIDRENSVLRVGPVVEMKDYVPRNISLVEFRSQEQLSENLNLALSGEVNSRHQRARMSLVSRRSNQDVAYMEVRAAGDYEVGIPYELQLTRSSQLRGSVIANESGAGTSLTISEDANARTEFSYFRDDLGERYRLDYRRNFTRKSTMTFRITKEDGETNSWLLYQYFLD